MFSLRIFGKNCVSFFFFSTQVLSRSLYSSSGSSVTRLTFHGLGFFPPTFIHFPIIFVLGKLYIDPFPLNYAGWRFFSISQISLYNILSLKQHYLLKIAIELKGCGQSYKVQTYSLLKRRRFSTVKMTERKEWVSESQNRRGMGNRRKLHVTRKPNRGLLSRHHIEGVTKTSMGSNQDKPQDLEEIEEAPIRDELERLWHCER